jgi:hypothetical protein
MRIRIIRTDCGALALIAVLVGADAADEVRMYATAATRFPLRAIGLLSKEDGEHQQRTGSWQPLRERGR